MHEERQRVDRSGPARVGLIRGVLVIVTAVAIGAFVVTQGLEDDGTESIAAASDVAVGSSDDGSVSADPDGPADGSADADGADDGRGTGGDAMAGESTGDPEPTAGDDAATADVGATGGDGSDPTSTTGTEPAGPEVRVPADVKVLVLNGAGAKGIAGRGSAILADAGYDVLAPKNADFLGPSLVLYTEGLEEEATAVAEVFGADPAAVVGPLDPADKPIQDTRNADIVVVVGQDGLISV